MLSIKMRNLKGLNNNDIFDQESQGYFPVISIQKKLPEDVLQSILSYRSSHPEKFLGKSVLKICSRFTGAQPCRSAISIKLLYNFIHIGIGLRYGYSPVNLLHIFRTSFPKHISEGLLVLTHFMNIQFRFTNLIMNSLDFRSLKNVLLNI